MEVIPTNKGGLKLVLDGHMYTKHATRKTKIVWKCSRKSSINCQGLVWTDLQNENPVVSKTHNHSGDDVQVSLTKLRMSMKRRAAQTKDKPGQIYAEATSAFNDDVIALLPDPETCKRTMRNQRPCPPAPSHRRDLGEIPEEFRTTVGDAPESFLIYDNGPQHPDRLLAFATKKGLELLANAETIYMDGNFKMAPKIFSQVYCIRVPFNDNTITAVYALLPNKTRACYEELLQAVVDKCEEMHLELNITTVVSDFEDAVLRAIMAVFGRDVSSRGCFYHFTQATWRHIQGLGLAAHYNQSEEFRLFCGMLDGLAFLPIDDVAEGMEYVKSRVADHPEGEELVEYFDRTYVSGTFRRRQGEGLALTVRRVAPMFPPHVWNVHETTLAGDARTNNVCEGWNTKFFNLVGHHHPSVWRTIEWFQKEQTTVRIVIAQDSIGNMPVKKTKSIFVKMQRRLHRLCTDIASGRKSVPEFLNGVAKNIRLNKTS